MQEVKLNIRFKNSSEEEKTLKVSSLEAVTAECRWLMKVSPKIESISFDGFGSKYTIERI